MDVVFQETLKFLFYLWHEMVPDNNGPKLANIMNDLNVLIVEFIGVLVKEIFFITTG